MLAITRKYADDPSKMGELRHPTNIKPLQEGVCKLDGDGSEFQCPLPTGFAKGICTSNSKGEPIDCEEPPQPSPPPPPPSLPEANVVLRMLGLGSEQLVPLFLAGWRPDGRRPLQRWARRRPGCHAQGSCQCDCSGYLCTGRRRARRRLLGLALDTSQVRHAPGRREHGSVHSWATHQLQRRDK